MFPSFYFILSVPVNMLWSHNWILLNIMISSKYLLFNIYSGDRWKLFPVLGNFIIYLCCHSCDFFFFQETFCCLKVFLLKDQKPES